MWYAVGPRPASRKRMPLPCTVHHRHRRRCNRPKVQQKDHLAVKLESREDWRTTRRDWWQQDRLHRERRAGKPILEFSKRKTPKAYYEEETKKTTEGPPRGGMKERPTRTDHMVTDGRISVEEKIPRKCGCGWGKTTTLRELHIHMGKKKCGGGSLMQTCTAPVRAGQTNGIQGRVDNHSANGPNVAEAEQEERKEEEERDVDEPQEVNSIAPLRTESSQRARNLKNPLRRNKIKWPKANKVEEWRKLDELLSGLLQKALRGSVVAKLKKSIRRQRKRKEKERSSFFRNPFRYARGLLEEKTSGILDVSKEELQEYIRTQYSDPVRKKNLDSPGYVPRPSEPSVLFDVSPPKFSEVRQVIQRVRSASAPGPTGIPYKLYKSCPGVLKLPWTLMRITWTKQTIPSEWQRAVVVYIPKQQDAKTIEQFRSIAPLNVEGKMFFSVMARRMTNYITENNYIDTSCQKAGIPGFPGCVELASMIWEQIQTTKREKKDLHVIWLDLANAYGSVPHLLIAYGLEFFYIPDNIRTMIMNYFQDMHMCFALKKVTTGWQQLEVEIAMGCSISPILFVAAFEVILIGARQVVGGVRLPAGQRLPPLRSYMDDITCLLRTAPCTSRLLKRLDELITWASMKFKPQQSRSLSLRKGERNDRVTFTISGEDIPRIVDQPIRSLGRLYISGLSDKDMGKIILRQLSEGLSKIDTSQLPGNFKVWCYHSTLHPRVMWPLKLCEVTSSAVSRMEAKANSFIRKWLGLPRCFSAAGLYGWNSLQLPLKSITSGHIQEKARLVMELRDSSDRAVPDVNARVETGRKWRLRRRCRRWWEDCNTNKLWAWSRQGGQASDGASLPFYGPKQARRRGRTLLLQRSPGLSRRSSEWGLWHRGSRGGGQLGRVSRTEQSAGQSSGNCHRLGSVSSLRQHTTLSRALKTSINSLGQSNPATSVGPSMPHSSMSCRAAKQHWQRVGSDGGMTTCSGNWQRCWRKVDRRQTTRVQ